MSKLDTLCIVAFMGSILLIEVATHYEISKLENEVDALKTEIECLKQNEDE